MNQELELGNIEDVAIKIGYLKHDLYCYYPPGRFDVADGSLHTEKQKRQIVRDSFDLAFPKGTKFVCYIDEECPGEEFWYASPLSCGDDYGAEEMSAEWAKEHLENITEV